MVKFARRVDIGDGLIPSGQTLPTTISDPSLHMINGFSIAGMVDTAGRTFSANAPEIIDSVRPNFSNMIHGIRITGTNTVETRLSNGTWTPAYTVSVPRNIWEHSYVYANIPPNSSSKISAGGSGNLDVTLAAPVSGMEIGISRSGLYQLFLTVSVSPTPPATVAGIAGRFFKRGTDLVTITEIVYCSLESSSGSTYQTVSGSRIVNLLSGEHVYVELTNLDPSTTHTLRVDYGIMRIDG